MGKAQKSKYSDYFDVNKEKATCRRCGTVIKLENRNTTGMKKHLANKHNIKLGDSSESGLPESVDSSTPSTSSGNLTPQRTMKNFFEVKKPPLEELIAMETADGASFRRVAKSNLMQKGMAYYGYQDSAPKCHRAVQRLTHKSAENHRQKMKKRLQQHLKNGHRFCAITDEWTCPAKKRKYLNVSLHLKGMNNFKLF